MAGDVYLYLTCFMHLRVGQASPAVTKCRTSNTSHFTIYRPFNFMVGNAHHAWLPLEPKPQAEAWLLLLALVRRSKKGTRSCARNTRSWCGVWWR